MGCNCGGQNKKNMVWEYKFNGQLKVYKTEVEARAAQIRNSGGTITPRRT
jgi:hypothetical protein